MSEKYCRIYNCNYAEFHTTRSHKCGKCRKFGHGIMECDEFLRINRLKRFFYEEMPPEKRCTIIYCDYKKYHSIESHQCSKCYQFQHSIDTCPTVRISSSSFNLPHSINGASSTYPPPPQTTYTPPVSLPALAPDTAYASAPAITSSLAPVSSSMTSASLLMSSPGYGAVGKKYIVTCYICKDTNDYDKTKIHVKADCGICLVNNVDFIFPCGHTCCEECFDSPSFSNWVKLN
jgi:hypothetical protein